MSRQPRKSTRFSTHAAGRAAGPHRVTAPARAPAVRRTIGREEFARRRRQLMRLMGRDTIAIIPAPRCVIATTMSNTPTARTAISSTSPASASPSRSRCSSRGASRPSTSCSSATATRSGRPGTAGGPAPKGRPASTGPTTPSPSATWTRSFPGFWRTRARVFYAMGTHPEFDQRVVGWLNGLRTQARTRGTPAPGVRGAGLRAARHAPVQIARRDRGHARLRAHRRRSPPARHALCRPGAPSTRSLRRSCTSSAATTPTPPTRPSSGAAPTAASCITARTTSR